MTEPVTPALTAEEWRRRMLPDPQRDRGEPGWVYYPNPFYDSEEEGAAYLDAGVLKVTYDSACVSQKVPDRHAIAALALYEQPFGFWPELPRTLRIAAEKLRTYTDDPDGWVDLDTAAARIGALLPPEEP